MLCKPRNRSKPRTQRSHLSTGFARRWRKISETSAQGRMERVAPIEDGDPVLVPQLEPHAGRERRSERRGKAPGVVRAVVRERERGGRNGRRTRLGPEADRPIARVAAVRLNLGSQVPKYGPLDDGDEADVPEPVGRPVGVVLAGVLVAVLAASPGHADRVDEPAPALVGS